MKPQRPFEAKDAFYTIDDLIKDVERVEIGPIRVMAVDYLHIMKKQHNGLRETVFLRYPFFNSYTSKCYERAVQWSDPGFESSDLWKEYVENHQDIDASSTLPMIMHPHQTEHHTFEEYLLRRLNPVLHTAIPATMLNQNDDLRLYISSTRTSGVLVKTETELTTTMNCTRTGIVDGERTASVDYGTLIVPKRRIIAWLNPKPVNMREATKYVEESNLFAVMSGVFKMVSDRFDSNPDDYEFMRAFITPIDKEYFLQMQFNLFDWQMKAKSKVIYLSPWDGE